jgi:hypothetical protein
MSNSNIPFLVMRDNALSFKLAKEVAIRTLIDAKATCPPNGWEHVTISWGQEPNKYSYSYNQLVNEAREKGYIHELQRNLDKSDSIFGGSIYDTGTPNWQFKVKKEYAGFSKEIQGPCRTALVEQDLTDDIIRCREEACEYSNQYDFRMLCRSFRGYLSASVSIVDAFINRHILLAEHEGFSSPEFEQLKTTKKMEDRVRLWFATCSNDDPEQFFNSASWCHFQELRKKRNEILHAIDPYGLYAIQEIQTYLNKVRTGVGELLLMMRIAHKKPTLGFIERLRTARLVDFNQITFRADEKHQIKVIQAQ